jgi:Ran GTPase-activating protein 1
MEEEGGEPIDPCVLRLGDEKREMVDGARMAALLAAKQSSAPERYTRVSLGGKSLSLEAARVLADTLQSLQRVQEFDLADVIAGRPEDEALDTLRTICGALRGRALRSIDLSENALGQKGVHACSAVLEEQSDLNALYVCNNGLSAEAAALLKNLLLFRVPTEVRVCASREASSYT